MHGEPQDVKMDARELGIVEESAGTDDHREAAGREEKPGPKERPKISLYKVKIIEQNLVEYA